MLADHRLAACLHGLLAASLLILCSCEDAGAGREKKKNGTPSAVAAPQVGAGNCKAPAPVDERLAKGLALYLEGDWQAALAPLQAWSASEGADRDPAAGRGYYSLGYALTATGRPQLADAWNAKAEPLLAGSVETSPNLEDLYYLASLHRTRRETGKQLDTVSKALALLEAGTLCPATDGDDDFRVARLLSFAGREEEKAARLEQAVAKYARGLGSVASYRALALQELGEAARQSGDWAAWEKHLAEAARLDPSLLNVHRSLGLAMLRRGALEEAAEYWRVNWRKERNAGNDLIYAVRVLRANVAYRERFGEEHRIAALSEFTKEALEQNAIFEAKGMSSADAALAAGDLAPEAEQAKQLERDLAHFRMSQLLTEYIAREHDVAEFALQNGLLPAIHGSGLPRR